MKGDCYLVKSDFLTRVETVNNMGKSHSTVLNF